MNEVVLFRDFDEDRRLSMEVYADGLSRALQEHVGGRWRVKEYRPLLFPCPNDGLLWLRLSRFGFYPWQARQHQGQINHILDQGYGHLLYALDPRRTIVTVHDVIPLVWWKGGIPGFSASAGCRPWLNLISFNALKRAGYLVADSGNTRRDLIRYCGCIPEKITVIHPGIDSIFRPYSAEEKYAARVRWGLPEDGTRRLLIIGRGLYKNHTSALRVFARLREKYAGPIQLIRTGASTPEWELGVRKLELEESVVSLGILPRARLPDVYNIADCLFFPSLYEGFGWPPLEAMACGTPVVASNAGSLPEVVGDAALMCDPQDEEGFKQTLHSVLSNEDMRKSLTEQGMAHARQFTWEHTAQQMLAVYEQVVRKWEQAAT